MTKKQSIAYRRTTARTVASLRRSIGGQRSFDSEKQNIPIDPDDCLFSDAKLRFWDDEYDSVDQLLAAKGKRGILLGACDPSMGKKSKGSDPSAIIVLLRDTKSDQLYVLEADIAIRTPEQTIDTILEYCRKYRFYRFAIETIQFQEFMAHELNRLRTKAIVIGKGRSGPRNPERELSAQLLGPIQSVRLYDLDGAGAVEQLAVDIKAHWLTHTSPDAP